MLPSTLTRRFKKCSNRCLNETPQRWSLSRGSQAASGNGPRGLSGLFKFVLSNNRAKLCRLRNIIDTIRMDTPLSGFNTNAYPQLHPIQPEPRLISPCFSDHHLRRILSWFYIAIIFIIISREDNRDNYSDSTTVHTLIVNSYPMSYLCIITFQIRQKFHERRFSTSKSGFVRIAWHNISSYAQPREKDLSSIPKLFPLPLH